LVDGRAWARGPLRVAFARQGWRIDVVTSADDALSALDLGPEPCCLIVETRLPGGRFGTVLEHTADLGYRSRLVVCSGGRSLIRPGTLGEYRPGYLIPRPITPEEIWSQPCPVCVGRVQVD
jgi:DNA-binding NtrC family response regulator